MRCSKFIDGYALIESRNHAVFLFLRPLLPCMLLPFNGKSLRLWRNGMFTQCLCSHEQSPNDMRAVQWAIFGKDFSRFRVDSSRQGFENLSCFA